MPGLYAPYKVYTNGEILTAPDLDATDINHITNQTPQMTDDYSQDLAQSRLQTDPATLAASLAGEIERLRFVIAKAGQVTNWDQIAALVRKAGDTMTGFLTLSGDPTLALHAVTRQ